MAVILVGREELVSLPLLFLLGATVPFCLDDCGSQFVWKLSLVPPSFVLLLVVSLALVPWIIFIPKPVVVPVPVVEVGYQGWIHLQFLLGELMPNEAFHSLFLENCVDLSIASILPGFPPVYEDQPELVVHLVSQYRLC